MQKHSLTRTAVGKTARRVGRGGKRGKTSGKGHKGQKARAGNSTRPEMRDIIKKLPKRRGYGKNRARTVVPGRGMRAVSLALLETHFNDGEVVTAKELVSRGIVRRVGGRPPQVKIVAGGELKKKLTVSGVSLTEAARDAVQKAGGDIR